MIDKSFLPSVLVVAGGCEWCECEHSAVVIEAINYSLFYCQESSYRFASREANLAGQEWGGETKLIGHRKNQPTCPCLSAGLPATTGQTHTRTQEHFVTNGGDKGGLSSLGITATFFSFFQVLPELYFVFSLSARMGANAHRTRQTFYPFLISSAVNTFAGIKEGICLGHH